MHITSIEFAGFSTTQSGASSGSVVLVSDDARMQIPLTLQRRVEVAHSRHRLLLLAEALRQARRIPEYRRRGTLTFAPGVLPPELRRA